MSHDNLAHELASLLAKYWLEQNNIKSPKLDSTNKIERKIAQFVLIEKILSRE